MKLSKKRIAICFCLFLCVCNINAQSLKVELSPDKSKVDRSTSNGTATVFFDSNIDDLSIICADERPDEPIQKIGKKVWFTHVNVKGDMELDGVCYRNFLLKSKSSAEYYLTTPDIGYNQVLYYTVILPDQFAKTLTAEYLFTKSALHGIRLSFGSRFGGYASYKWGAYYKAGANIMSVTEDYDISKAICLGYIRNAITGGVKLGLLSNHKVKFPFELYMLMGAGYGEYGRQWKNTSEIDKNIFFYSDYTKGLDAELSIQTILYDWFSISAGIEMVTGNSNITFDYQIGLGLNVPFSKLHFKKYK